MFLIVMQPKLLIPFFNSGNQIFFNNLKYFYSGFVYEVKESQK
jgi:hypothetical protein